MLLELSDVSLSLKRDGKYVKILDQVSFEVNKGETVGIVGESGCGKSMTALSIMRLLPEKAKLSGEITLDNENVMKYSRRTMEKVRGNKMAMIFQDPLTSLNPLQTVGRQIEETLLLHTDLTKDQRKERVIHLLTEVGLPRAKEIASEYPHQLSGGMRQRVMIAISMACNPSLLICDEPTTALDVTVQAQILDLMNRLKVSNEMSIIMITHDLGVVAEVCDRVVVMYAGKVVEQAEVKELFLNPKHPYTKGLLESIPKLGVKKEKLGSIPGMVPSPDKMPHGCRFFERCPSAMEKCRGAVPPMVEVGNEHTAACWLYEGKEGEVPDANVGSKGLEAALHN
ncbi:ABC transporter ATP-binding protein [Neobacillus notoginsengisoli]|uniref:ABC transporter ATP-binding protein n=1 Tax=Neobacillus notoginsengisoli TaxID=1578198 RepID=A0A417YRW2_9BACI|nr:ABC transporter ATP-binding protein [Neobacillus notoginsengisoli]RHW38032.1 ABC transporter ATP-binding protein [Neobacillus notoginsengisoli]